MGSELIRMEELRKIYKMGSVDIYALRGLSLYIKQKEFVSIMGPSGSGKSTLMNIIGCMDRPTDGRYLLEGVDIRSLGKDELAQIRNKRIGFIFQGFNLLPRHTALENVELPLLYSGTAGKERRERAMEALSKVGLAGRSGHFSTQLSGGEQQRVAIARALVKNPPLILADEPTGNLDSRTSTEVMEILQTLNEKNGITIILVTHEKDIALFSKRIIKLRDGKVESDSIIEEPIRAVEFTGEKR
ncbi:MAG TPA: ABC transporter ATP-binding protein [Nitrospiria bacterium]|nr:ABC transporter ATP-binding protein [Nitrospiria bacterium]